MSGVYTDKQERSTRSHDVYIGGSMSLLDVLLITVGISISAIGGLVIGILAVVFLAKEVQKCM